MDTDEPDQRQTEDRLCVYTTLIGRYEALNEQPVAPRSSIPFICLTDDESLASETWQIRQVRPVFALDPIRSQRELKIRPHAHLPGFDRSIYIDNSVILSASPEAILSAFPLPESGIAVPLHSFRASVLDEFLEVAELGYDDPHRIFEQLSHYQLAAPDVMAEQPFWDGIMLRDHRNERLQAMLDIWAAHVHRYSRRDQLSLNMAFRQSGLTPAAMAIDNNSSWMHRWPVTSGRERSRAPRSLTHSLAPPLARLRLLEREIERLRGTPEGSASRATPPAPLATLLRRRVAKTLDGINPFRPRHRPPVFPAPAPPRPPPAAPAAPRVHVAPGDERGRELLEAGGDLNPPTLRLWRRLAAAAPWSLVIDVGANYGEMLVGTDFPPAARLVAVEPSPQILPFLRRTLAEAGMSVEIIAAAASDAAGTGHLFIDPHWSGRSRLDAGEDGGTVEVALVTLSALLGEGQQGTMLLAKIDVEGHEARVLRELAPALPRLKGFAALVEVLHMADDDLAWLFVGFDVFLHELATGMLVPAGQPSAAALRALLDGRRYCGNDVVIVRRGEPPPL